MSRQSAFKTPEGEAAFIAAYDDTMKHLPVPYEERDIPTRFGLTHVVVSGPRDAAPLVNQNSAFLHSLMLRMRAAFERSKHHSAIVAKLLAESDLGRVVAGNRHRFDRAKERDAWRVLGGRRALCGERRQGSRQLCCRRAGDVLADTRATAIVEPGQPLNEFGTL